MVPTVTAPDEAAPRVGYDASALTVVAADLLVVPVFTDRPTDDPALRELEAAYRATGRSGRSGQDLAVAAPGFATPEVLLVGMGEVARCDVDGVRRTAQRLARSRPATARVATTLHTSVAGDRTAAAVAVVQGWCAGRYRFDRFRTRDLEPRPPLDLVFCGAEASQHEHHDAVNRAAMVEHYTHWVRDLVNLPARELTPAALADTVAALALDEGLTVEVHGPEDLVRMGCGGIAAVGAGSRETPRLVTLRYTAPGDGPRPTVALVGKGITFDSGGLSLKRPAAMAEMKSDMAGAAVAVAVVRAVAALRLDVDVVAWAACAENMPGGGATRPGDVLTHRNGLTSEVVDTDCEGRLVLADALALAAEERPAAILDLATLTYACVTALGLQITTALGNRSDLTDAVRRAGAAVGEPVWELPLWPGYLPLIASDVADLRNDPRGDNPPDAIAAALFLEHFVADTPWVHLDIGGTAWAEESDDHWVVGGTGTMVRTLVQLLSEHTFGTGPVPPAEVRATHDERPRAGVA